MSYTRLRISATVSCSSDSMWKRARSGVKAMEVQLSSGEQGEMAGSPFCAMFLVNTCRGRGAATGLLVGIYS